MDELSLHILDLIQNSISANAKFIEIEVVEDDERDFISICIKDDGNGMDEEELKMAVDPFFTTKGNKKVGLGIPLLKQSALHCDGDFWLKSKKKEGTMIFAKFRKSHIDTPPLGDMVSTIVSLIPLCDRVDIKFKYIKNKREFVFDSREIKRELEGLPFTNLEVLKFIKNYVKENLREIEKTKGGKDDKRGCY